MPRRRLFSVSVLLAALMLAGGCTPITLTQVQQRLAANYAGGCVVPPRAGGVAAIQVVGFKAIDGPNNLIYSYHDDTDDSYGEGTFYPFTVPGVPVAVAKCLDDNGVVRKIAVVSSNGQAYMINADFAGSNPVPLGASNVFTVRGLEFASQGKSGRKNLIAYGDGGGPFSSMAVYVEQPDGTHGSPGFPTGLGSLSSVAAANLDGKEADELVVGGDDGGQNIKVMSYDELTGVYSVVSGLQTGGVAGRVAAVDLGGDGIEEVVVLNRQPGVNGDTVQVYGSNGDGTLSLIDTEPVAAGPTHVAFGDVNGDGMTDAAVACGIDDEITMLLGAPGSMFDGSSRHLSPDLVADLAFVPSDSKDPDAPQDLLVISSFEQVAVLYRSDGEDLLSEQFSYLPQASDAREIVAANFDSSADGSKEIKALVVSTDGSTRQLYDIGWDAGADTFGAAALDQAVTSDGPMMVGDFDGVNGPDLLMPNFAGGTIELRNDGAGNLVAESNGLADGSFVTAIGVARLNDDETDDAIVLAQNVLTSWFAFSDEPWQQGPGTYAPGTTMTLGRYDDGSIWAATAHRNLDDISFWDFMSDGTPVLSDTVTVETLDGPRRLASGDWNGDGHDDAVLVVVDAAIISSKVVLMLSDGTGGFEEQVLFEGAGSEGWNLLCPTMADIDLDGDMDLLCPNNGASASDQFVLGILQGQNRGILTYVEMYLTGDPIGCVLVEEMSGDGRPWILTGKTGSRVGVSALPTLVAAKGGPCNQADLVKPFGVLDFFDLQQFLNLFAAFDLSVDLNFDGTLDFFDLQQYLNAFSTGCP